MASLSSSSSSSASVNSTSNGSTVTGEGKLKMQSVLKKAMHLKKDNRNKMDIHSHSGSHNDRKPYIYASKPEERYPASIFI
ncbi:uncharacterized protein ARMOST_03192 [Armillaria ostoyae]|uniref:Uncharacterized protein n=1 Tax=Armillaria ostoyae TaxID=47428 RepID=A0A284QU06_ARMOS|nr:uncharacterized protein ARMOST_03192 [Armillaria ostoyae]